MMDDRAAPVQSMEGEFVELVEEDGSGWCSVCGDPLERGQEVTFRAGVRSHVDEDFEIGATTGQALLPEVSTAGGRRWGHFLEAAD